MQKTKRLNISALYEKIIVNCGNAFSLRSNRTLIEASHPSRTERYETLCLTGIRYATEVMVVGEG